MSRTPSGARLSRRVITLGALVTVASNVMAIAVVVCLLLFGLPQPEGTDGAILLNIVTTAVYVGIAIPLRILAGVGRARRRLVWLGEGREPDDRERRATVGLPLAVVRVQTTLWLTAAVVFSVLNIRTSGLLAIEIGLTVLIGGLVSAATSYLLIERVNRPALAQAMRSAPPRSGSCRPASTRWSSAWPSATASATCSAATSGRVWPARPWTRG